MNEETRARAATLTASGRGALGTIRVVAATPELVERAGFRPVSGRSLAEIPVDRIVFGHWGDPPEDVVVCRVDEQTIEVHCHGGGAATGRIEQHLVDAGAEIVEPFDLVAPSASGLDRDVHDVLLRATTLRTARIALEQSNGLLRSTLSAIRDKLVAGDAGTAATYVDELLRWSDVGTHLATPWRVVLTGRPNVGKSSLVNALLGYGRAIVFDQPGTTRDVVTAETALEGWPVVLSDTAGLRDGADPLESAGIDRARAALTSADCRVTLLDVSRPADPVDLELLRAWPNAIVVAHKCDLPRVHAAIPDNALFVSSVTEEGVDALAARIVESLVPIPPPDGTAMPVTASQLASLRVIAEAIGRDDADAARRKLVTLLGE